MMSTVSPQAQWVMVARAVAGRVERMTGRSNDGSGFDVATVVLEANAEKVYETAIKSLSARPDVKITKQCQEADGAIHQGRAGGQLAGYAAGGQNHATGDCVEPNASARHELVGGGRRAEGLQRDERRLHAREPVRKGQKGRLRVTVTSANGKEVTIALVGAGEFLGENSMVSAHPLRLEAATAMTECALLRIRKAEMVRVLYREQEWSDMFVCFLLARDARIGADLAVLRRNICTFKQRPHLASIRDVSRPERPSL
jgi:hypothetical protein